MRHLIIAIAAVVGMTGCSSTPAARACQFEWNGPEIETTCRSRLEISGRYLVLWITIEDGHLVVATARGRFPEDLREPIGVVHLAMVTPDGDDYWCSTETSPIQCGFSVEMGEDGDRAAVVVETYVSRDQEGWHYLRLVTDADVAWVEDE